MVKTGTIWGAEQVFQKSGVQPGQIVDWLSLVGDAVDDIPGVFGVGPKTAAKWLGQFGALEALLQRIDEVQPERLRAPLADMGKDLTRNQQLVRLREDLPLPTAPPDLLLRNTDFDQLRILYTRWGFHSLLHALEASRQQDLL